MSDYIPRRDSEKMVWMVDFAAWLEGNGATYGVTPAQISALNSHVAASQAALKAHIAAQDAARAATRHKNTVMGDAVAICREYVQRLQHDLTMTDAKRAEAGFTVPDGIPTAPSPDAISLLAPPLLLLDFSMRHQVTIHWGPNPGNEHENAKPRGVMGCEIQYALGSLPVDERDWVVLGLDTASPMVHHFTGNEATTCFYRARYLDKKLRHGNFGDPVECTVTV
jgi:hypothetical protein